MVGLVVFALWQLPYFGWVQYPFQLLGTWFHEMGHGITALLVGGHFHHLEIFENGGGVAYSSIEGSYLPYDIARAFTAAGGLLGPAVVGALLIVCGKKRQTSIWAIRILIAVIIMSLLLWIRSFWGIIVLSVFALVLWIITRFQNHRLERVTILFLGVQSILSTYLQLNYLFTKDFERDGAIQLSDTEVIAQHTIGTYWMWAVIIIGISCYLIWKSFRYYSK